MLVEGTNLSDQLDECYRIRMLHSDKNLALTADYNKHLVRYPRGQPAKFSPRNKFGVPATSHNTPNSVQFRHIPLLK